MLDKLSGSGGIYRLASDDWIAVAATADRPAARWERAADGSVFNIGVDASLRLDQTAGTWREVEHPQPESALPTSMVAGAQTSWTVDVWTGNSLLRWRPQLVETSGCENPPPNVGCDPRVQFFSFNSGVMTRLVP